MKGRNNSNELNQIYPQPRVHEEIKKPKEKAVHNDLQKDATVRAKKKPIMVNNQDECGDEAQ